MPKFILPKGETSVILVVFIQDSSATDGSGLGSLDQTSSIVGGYVRRNGTGVALAVDQNVTTEGTYEAPSTAGQVRIGTPANMRTGYYELHFHNNLFAAGSDYVTISLGGASNMAELGIEVQLTDVDLNDSTRGGMSALPNASAGGNGGVPTVNANNYVAGVQGTKNTFDALNDIAAGAAMNLSDGAITDAKIATNAITAPKIAEDAITSSELATSAVQEIRDSVLAGTIDTGMSLTNTLKRLLAVLDGNSTGDTDAGTQIYQDRDGSTEITHTISSTGSRTRS